MRWLLFISRVAFLCNICFILCMLMLYFKDFVHNQSINNYIIILGYSGFFLNLFLNFFIVKALYGKKQTFIPAWLVVFNLFVFILQVIYFFI